MDGGRTALSSAAGVRSLAGGVHGGGAGAAGRPAIDVEWRAPRRRVQSADSGYRGVATGTGRPRPRQQHLRCGVRGAVDGCCRMETAAAGCALPLFGTAAHGDGVSADGFVAGRGILSAAGGAASGRVAQCVVDADSGCGAGTVRRAVESAWPYRGGVQTSAAGGALAAARQRLDDERAAAGHGAAGVFSCRDVGVAMSALRKAERLYRHVLQQIERLGGAAARQQRQPSSAADVEGYWTALEHTVRAQLATVLWRRQRTERSEPAVDRLDAALAEAERVLGCASAPVAAQAEALVVQAHGGILPVVTAAQRESGDAALVTRWLHRAADVCEKQCIPLPPGAFHTPSASAEAVTLPPHARLLASVAQ
eukprot:ctg_755.g308